MNRLILAQVCMMSHNVLRRWLGNRVQYLPAPQKAHALLSLLQPCRQRSWRTFRARRSPYKHQMLQRLRWGFLTSTTYVVPALGVVRSLLSDKRHAFQCRLACSIPTKSAQGRWVFAWSLAGSGVSRGIPCQTGRKSFYI